MRTAEKQKRQKLYKPTRVNRDLPCHIHYEGKKDKERAKKRLSDRGSIMTPVSESLKRQREEIRYERYATR